MVDVVDDGAGAGFGAVVDTVLGEAVVVGADVITVFAVVAVVLDGDAVDETDEDDVVDETVDEPDDEDDDVTIGGVVVNDVDDSTAADGPVGSDIRATGGVGHRSSSKTPSAAGSPSSPSGRLTDGSPDETVDGDTVSIH